MSESPPSNPQSNQDQPQETPSFFSSWWGAAKSTVTQIATSAQSLIDHENVNASTVNASTTSESSPDSSSNQNTSSNSSSSSSEQVSSQNSFSFSSILSSLTSSEEFKFISEKVSDLASVSQSVVDKISSSALDLIGEEKMPSSSNTSNSSSNSLSLHPLDENKERIEAFKLALQASTSQLTDQSLRNQFLSSSSFSPISSILKDLNQNLIDSQEPDKISFLFSSFNSSLEKLVTDSSSSISSSDSGALDLTFEILDAWKLNDGLILAAPPRFLQIVTDNCLQVLLLAKQFGDLHDDDASLKRMVELVDDLRNRMTPK